MVDFWLGSKYGSAAQLLQLFLNKVGWIPEVNNWEYSPYEYLGVHDLLFWKVDSAVAEAYLAYGKYFLYFFLLSFR